MPYFRETAGDFFGRFLSYKLGFIMKLLEILEGMVLKSRKLRSLGPKLMGGCDTHKYMYSFQSLLGSILFSFIFDRRGAREY